MTMDYSVLSKQLEEIMESIFEENPDTYMDFDEDGTYYSIRQYDLEDNAMERLIERVTSDMTDEELKEFNANLETFEEKVKEGVSEDIYSILEEQDIGRRKDIMEYEKNPLAYHGMKQSDFL